MNGCAEELCENWSGDGMVCPCAVMGIEREPVWPSGIGGAQCDECYRFTIVRAVGRDELGEPTEYVCRACAEGSRQ